jgi:hypothetical protein
LSAPWESEPGGLHVCAKLIHRSEPFDAGQVREVIYALAPCHGVREGTLRMILELAEGERAPMLGDEITLRLRGFD